MGFLILYSITLFGLGYLFAVIVNSKEFNIVSNIGQICDKISYT